MALYAFDGTGNFDEIDDKKDTNVVRFKELYTDDTFYLPGVGTRLGALGAVLGGAFGAGGHSRIDEMMESLRSNYLAGDTTVDVIGFSRGAALAVHFCNKLAKEGISLTDGTTVNPEIRFLGVWDVVGSFGLSFNNILDFQEINVGWDIKSVPMNVKTCRHAIAIDERREAFNVTKLESTSSTDLKEVWFKGVHSDVGGGNMNYLRSNIALNWMIDEASKIGVSINVALRDEDKYSNTDLDAPISENKDLYTDPKRNRAPSEEVHQSATPRELAIGESHAVNVIAKNKFNWGRVKLTKNQQYKIWTQEIDTWDDDNITCNASGWTSEQLSFIKESAVKIFEDNRRYPEADWFELIGAYDNDESAHFFRIGIETTLTAEQDGELYLFANDLQSRYGNNDGLIRTFIERVA